jgi:hypothetical protein
MSRSIVAIVVGYILWSVLWIGGNQALVAAGLASADQRSSTGVLIFVLVFSVICSLVAGAALARIAPGNAIRDARIAGILLLVTGIYVEMQYWDLAPVWYHLVFLLLLLPATIHGARRLGGV